MHYTAIDHYTPWQKFLTILYQFRQYLGNHGFDTSQMGLEGEDSTIGSIDEKEKEADGASMVVVPAAV